MIPEPTQRQHPLPGAPALADDPADAAIDQGRIGYGRMGRFSPLILGLLLLLAVLVIWLLQRDAPAGEILPAPPAGEMAPDVSLTLLDGSSLRLADLRGEVVVLNFWASWCAPCRQEMPELQAYWEEARASGERTEIVGVGVRTDHDESARSVVAEGGYTYPIGRDSDTDRPGVLMRRHAKRIAAFDARGRLSGNHHCAPRWADRPDASRAAEQGDIAPDGR